MGDLQWQKDRCVEWLLARWTQCVPAERTKQWAARMRVTITVEQLRATEAELGRLSDDEFCRWLLDTAEPWQQSLLWSTLQGVIRSIEGLTEFEPLRAAIALHMRDDDSLRSILRQMLAAYCPRR